MILERLARAHRQIDASMVWSRSDPDPVELVQRNFHFASLEDPVAFRVLDVIGADRVMVESDLPHGDSTWPNTQQLLRSTMGHLDPNTVRQLCFENAAKLYGRSAPPAELIESSEVGWPPDRS
jgi:predicted TIM-barrel fold metal-dependent hydrolase